MYAIEQSQEIVKMLSEPPVTHSSVFDFLFISKSMVTLYLLEEKL